jgi:ribosomal protein S18 acetylase RimI-like enzyme
MPSNPRSIRGLIARAFSSLRDEGAWAFVQKTASALGLRRLLLIEEDLGTTPATPLVELPINFRILRVSEIESYLASEPEMSRVETERELASGRTCILACVEGQVAASMWVARDYLSSSWCRVRRELAKDEAYVFKVHTAAAFRRRGINKALNHYLADWLRKSGVRRACLMVMPWNLQARAAHSKAGFRECGQFISIGMGRLRTCLFLARAPVVPPKDVTAKAR